MFIICIAEMTTKTLVVSQGFAGTEFQWLMIFRWEDFLDLGYLNVFSKFCHTIDLYTKRNTVPLWLYLIIHVTDYIFTIWCIRYLSTFLFKEKHLGSNLIVSSEHFLLHYIVPFWPPLPIGHGLRSLLCGILAEAAKVGDGWGKCHFLLQKFNWSCELFF